MTADARYLQAIEARLCAYMDAPGIPDALADSMRYSLAAGGKRLRPRMALAACEMVGGDMEAALPLSCALEMIHTYSLIHDDLPCMDDDDFRRGKPTNHKAFGEGRAVLAGDGLLSYAFEIMLDAALVQQAKSPGYLQAVQAIAAGAGVFGMVAGQARDLANEKAPVPNEATLRAIHCGKTGAMLTASLLAGAYAAGAEEPEIEALRNFGEAYGLLFQITDDMLDVEGDLAQLGKTPGKDAKQQKLTYVTLYGLAEAKRLAEATAADALEALAPFGERAAYFRELTEKTLERNA